MKSLLVLCDRPELGEAIRAGLNPELYRVLERASVEEAEPLLAHGLVEACVLEAEPSCMQGVWLLERLRRRAPRCPIILYATAAQSEWEEEAYLQGATYVLAKPVRPRLLGALLDRLWTVDAASPGPAIPPPTATRAFEDAPPLPMSAAQTLGVVRDFSRIMTHSLDAEGMLKQFLLLLREILSVNRAAIFLRQPFAGLSPAGVGEASRPLHAACAMGLPSSLLRHFDLTFVSGIGGHLFRLGRILRRSSEEARNDPAAQREFEILGAQVAVPILDRETVLGAAVLDGRVTGEPLLNAELELVFHLLEQLGLAVKNIWLHDQLSASHATMAEVLRELSSACVVVDRDLTVLHANRMARRWFAGPGQRSGDLDFRDLPQSLGSRIYTVLKTGVAASNFRFEPEGKEGTAYNISVVPLQRQPGGLAGSALLMAEDITQAEQFQRLEVETAKLRLIRLLGDRLTHEIGNAMVPLSVHQQMLAEKLEQDSVEPDFLRTMEADMADGVKRVSRLVNQMRFLARDGLPTNETFPLAPLLEDAYQEARRHLPGKGAQLTYETASRPILLTGERAALKHAFAEVMLNALQANPADPKVRVRLRGESADKGQPALLQIEVADNGPGFSPEALQKATWPFFTTRSVGLGLGLTVAQKIIESHQGKLQIVPPPSGFSPQHGLVRISLPVNAATDAKPGLTPQPPLK